MNPYDIHEAIASNAIFAHYEPGDDGTNVIIQLTTSEIIRQGIERDQYIRKEHPQHANKPIPSANDMVLDHIAIHWAYLDKEATKQEERPTQKVSAMTDLNELSFSQAQGDQGVERMQRSSPSVGSSSRQGESSSAYGPKQPICLVCGKRAALCMCHLGFSYSPNNR